MENSLDLGQIYGLNDCPGGICPYTQNFIPDLPSLEEIASYNLAQRRLTRDGTPQQRAALRRLGETLGESGNTLPDEAPQTQSTENVRDQSADGVSRAYQQGEEGVQSSFGIASGITNRVQTGTAATNESRQMITEYSQPFPVTAESIQYLNGFMRTQVGRKIEIQMLVGSDSLITKTGYLLGVGANYILINEIGTGNLMSCDFYNIKFVRYFYE